MVLKTRRLTEVKLDELHEKLIKELHKFVDEFQELDVTPFILCSKKNQKGFSVLTDNGNGGKTKKFNIIIEEF